MGYRRRTNRSTYRSRARSYSGRYRRTTRRRRGSRRASSQRIVIQVIGGAGGVAASPVTLGKKGGRPVRSRY